MHCSLEAPASLNLIGDEMKLIKWLIKDEIRRGPDRRLLCTDRNWAKVPWPCPLTRRGPYLDLIVDHQRRYDGVRVRFCRAETSNGFDCNSLDHHHGV
ncbi:hypothetical protein AAC387_Pa03g1786 [Persea americana]